jgi:hypothetical protein
LRRRQFQIVLNRFGLQKFDLAGNAVDGRTSNARHRFETQHHDAADDRNQQSDIKYHTGRRIRFENDFMDPVAKCAIWFFFLDVKTPKVPGIDSLINPRS